MSQNQNPYDQFVNVDYASLSDWIFSFSGPEFAVVGTLIGVMISTQLNVYQQSAIGNFFEQIGQTLLTTSAQENNRMQMKSTNINATINYLEQEIIRLRNEINSIKNKTP